MGRSRSVPTAARRASRRWHRQGARWRHPPRCRCRPSCRPRRPRRMPAPQARPHPFHSLAIRRRRHAGW
ncbi:MAG: hypothetical protein DI563_14780 [Variovorax paradoxus]|uniref:Uncharacterized protein n=1 Tax=Variovorax paradoxus TaxID=34073 RepID=A0A2W5Q8H8_VARPD|nr:MAG: hypothetical protein DI563_14780 [Variovorax paradoxus]